MSVHPARECQRLARGLRGSDCEDSKDSNDSGRDPKSSVATRFHEVARAHRLERRVLYVGDGLSVRLFTETGEVPGEVIDLTPEGLGIAVLDDAELPATGDRIALEHTGRATRGIRQAAIVRHVDRDGLGRRRLPRIGVAVVAVETPSGAAAERRQATRYPCRTGIPAVASAPCPVFFREWLHFAVIQIGAGGMTLMTSVRNTALLAGLELALSVTFPMAEAQQVRGRITSVRRANDDRHFSVGFAWFDPSRELLHAAAEYLLLCDKGVTPAGLRRCGLTVGSIERAVTFGYASGAEDHAEILALRLRAHQAEGRLPNIRPGTLASTYDSHSRHLICRFGDRIVGYYRVNFVEGDRLRSQYVVDGEHVIPKWLWAAGFVEVGAAAIEPEFQRCGLCSALLRHTLRVALQTGYRHLVAAVSDDLLPVYLRTGFREVDRRMVEPIPGWRFRSHLVWLGVDTLTTSTPGDGERERMSSVVAFADASLRLARPR